MIPSKHKTLIDVLEHTFEDFAFMFVNPVQEEAPAPPEGQMLLRAGIRFYGPDGPGTLTATASMEFCRALGQNILGLDFEDELQSGAAESALCELVNVTCGSLGEALYGADEPFDIDPPWLERLGIEAWNELSSSAGHLVVRVDDEPVGISLCLDHTADD